MSYHGDYKINFLCKTLLFLRRSANKSQRKRFRFLGENKWKQIFTLHESFTHKFMLKEIEKGARKKSLFNQSWSISSRNAREKFYRESVEWKDDQIQCVNNDKLFSCFPFAHNPLSWSELIIFWWSFIDLNESEEKVSFLYQTSLIAPHGVCGTSHFLWNHNEMKKCETFSFHIFIMMSKLVNVAQTLIIDNVKFI